MSKEHDTSHILTALAVNAGIALIKGVAAFFTGSGSMMAETLHSASDCINQGLLLFGVKRASKAPDAKHPLGYGRALYFWSFMVALLLFTGGGVFSIYEGIHKTMHPEPMENVGWAMGILLVSLILEGGSTLSNIKQLNAKRGNIPFFKYIQQTKDSDLIVVFGENSAASLGLAFALLALLASVVTGDPHWDGIGCIAVGAVLIGVAIFLAIEVKSLLMGEAADPTIEAGLREVALADEAVEEVLRVITLQQGPGEVLVAMKVRLKDGLDTAGVVAAINEYERKVHVRLPEVRWLFVEPDHHI